MSAIRKNAKEATTGTIKGTKTPPLCSRDPRSRLEKTAISSIMVHAALGIRFSQAAWVNPCEFRTSFMPETARAVTGVACAVAARTTDD
jgi:hypothetical protein